MMTAMMIKRNISILLALFPLILFGQPINDFGTWWGIEIKKKVHKDIKISVRAEARLNENSESLKNFYIAPTIKYEPLSWFAVSFQYRFDNRYEREGQYFNFRHRIGLDLDFKYKVKRLEFGYRNRTQMYWQDEYANDIYYPVMTNRNQLNVTYKWPNLPFKTGVSSEIWIPLEIHSSIDRFRATVDQEYILKTRHHFHLRFIFQTNLDPTNKGLLEFILSTRYVFDF